MIRLSFSNSIQVLVCFLLFTSSLSAQEIGRIRKGNHSIELLKLKDTYSMVYSDVNTKSDLYENTIYFSIKETVYEIIMNGFDTDFAHQIILKTANDTIVKFEFRDVKGERMVKIRQNNLAVNTFGTSTFFTKYEMQTLFGNP